MKPMAGGALPREGEKKPAEQEAQGRSRGRGGSAYSRLGSAAPLELPEGSWHSFMEPDSIALVCGEEGSWAGLAEGCRAGRSCAC